MEAQINKAYKELARRLANLHEAQGSVIELENRYKKEAAEAFLVAEGKTVKAKEVEVETKCRLIIDRLEYAKAKLNFTQFQFRLAEIEVERIRLIVRFMEIKNHNHYAKENEDV